jgi:hypothetical protein
MLVMVVAISPVQAAATDINILVERIACSHGSPGWRCVSSSEEVLEPFVHSGMCRFSVRRTVGSLPRVQSRGQNKSDSPIRHLHANRISHNKNQPLSKITVHGSSSTLHIKPPTSTNATILGKWENALPGCRTEADSHGLLTNNQILLQQVPMRTTAALADLVYLMSKSLVPRTYSISLRLASKHRENHKSADASAPFNCQFHVSQVVLVAVPVPFQSNVHCQPPSRSNPIPSA